VDDDKGLTKKGTPSQRRASSSLGPPVDHNPASAAEREAINRKYISEAPNVAEAVQRAAKLAAVPCTLHDYQAQAIADAARSFADSTVHVTRGVARRDWEDDQFRHYVRDKMRYDLLALLTKQGLIPVDLPAESVKYLDRWFNPDVHDAERVSGIPPEAVKAGTEWETIMLMLSVPVRRPPVDRAAAVRAGILAGPVTP
jgi:hypothetical protein